MSIWVVYPSASVARCNENLRHWATMGYRAAVTINTTDRPNDHAICADMWDYSEAYLGFPYHANRLARLAFGSDPDCTACVFGSDDIYPCTAKPRQELESEFKQHFGGTFGVMNLSGHHVGQWATNLISAWVGREYFARAYHGNGHLCEEYHHMYSDTEAYAVTQKLGVLWRRDDLQERHEHHSITGYDTLPADKRRDLYRLLPADRLMYLRRAADNFPGSEPI